MGKHLSDDPNHDECNNKLRKNCIHSQSSKVVMMIAMLKMGMVTPQAMMTMRARNNRHHRRHHPQHHDHYDEAGDADGAMNGRDDDDHDVHHGAYLLCCILA